MLDSPHTHHSVPALHRIGEWLRGPTGSRGVEGNRLLGKWVLLGLAIGVVAGAGAILFTLAIDWMTHLALGLGAAYEPPTPLGEGGHGISAAGRPWLLPLIVGFGAFLGGVLVRWLAPEAEGHGTDAAIEAFHLKAGRVRRRIPPIKLVASALTIGAGGSGGREGPTAQISAGFGSALADWLHLSPHDRRLTLATGIGAGIGAIFRAPLGGAMMGAEILYKHDLEVEAIIPSLIASIVGYSIYGAVMGWTPIFGNQVSFGFHDPLQLVSFAALGVICGLVGILYARSFYTTHQAFERLPGPWVLRPALAGILVGLIALVLPGVLHTGYGWAQAGFDPNSQEVALWVLLLLPFAKILATSLSIGSGGSGGIFGPGIVIGGMLGAAVWHLTRGMPGVPDSPGPFVIVGMMALFGSIAHAPLAVMLMVAEMTGNLALLAPAMVAVGVATLLVGDRTIYDKQLSTRADSPAHRFRYSFPLLTSLPVQDAMIALPAPPSPAMLVHDALDQMETMGIEGLPLADERGGLTGVVGRRALSTVPPEQRDTRSVGEFVVTAPEPVRANASLDAALDALAEYTVTWLPVVDEQDRLVGVLSALSLSRAYRQAARGAPTPPAPFPSGKGEPRVTTVP